MASRGERMMRARAALLILVALAAVTGSSAAPVAAAKCSGTAPRQTGCTVIFPSPSPLTMVNISADGFVGTIFARATSEQTGAYVQESCSIQTSTGRPLNGVAPSAGTLCSWARSGLFAIGEPLTLKVTTALQGAGTPAAGAWSVTAG